MKEEEDLNRSQSYKSDDDIENFLPIDRDNKLNIDREKLMDYDSNYNSDIAHSHISSKDQHVGRLILQNYNSNPVKLKKEEDNLYQCKKNLNILTSLNFLIILIYFLIYGIYQHRLNFYHDKFKTKIQDFQISFEVFMSIWSILILILFLNILRNCFLFTEDLYEIKEIKEIITFKISHLFYLSNIFLIIGILIFYNDFYHKYGITIGVTFISSLLYLLTYIKIKNSKISGFLNTLGFSISLSFLLALSNILNIISIIKWLELSVYFLENSEIIAIIFHLILFTSAILFLVFYKDLYYMLFIILFQAGILIENRKNFSNQNKFILIFIIFTFISFIFSLLCVSHKVEEKSEDLEIIYKAEKEREQIL